VQSEEIEAPPSDAKISSSDPDATWQPKAAFRPS
jgi:hypothetical protein